MGKAETRVSDELRYRIMNDWSIEKAFKTPVRRFDK